MALARISNLKCSGNIALLIEALESMLPTVPESGATVETKKFCFLKKDTNELAAFKLKLADQEQRNQKLQLENEALVKTIDSVYLLPSQWTVDLDGARI